MDTLTFQDVVRAVTALLPDAVFDEDYRTGEIMIATGLVLNSDSSISKFIPDSFYEEE